MPTKTAECSREIVAYFANYWKARESGCKSRWGRSWQVGCRIVLMIVVIGLLTGKKLVIYKPQNAKENKWKAARLGSQH
jgi:hypothetical protein